MIKIVKETDNDSVEVEYLYDLAFGPGRRSLSSYQFRDGITQISELSLVMRDEYEVIVGAIRFWPVRIGYQLKPCLLLGPLGVHPIRHGEGLGELLIKRSLSNVKRLGWTRIILIGDLEYYGRFGFSRSIVKKIYMDNKHNSLRLLGREVVSGSFGNLEGPVYRWD